MLSQETVSTRVEFKRRVDRIISPVHLFAGSLTISGARCAALRPTRRCEKTVLPVPGIELTQLSGVVTIGLLLLFFGGTLIMSITISRKRENADGYMTAGNKLGFGISAASMTATWIWAASMYASAASGYTYGISVPIHYGLWGALMILFIYPFGRRIRKVAPRPHTLAAVMYARHGRSSQLCSLDPTYLVA